jgi:Rhs element Vgr protein
MMSDPGQPAGNGPWSPLVDADGAVNVAILSNGGRLPENIQLVSAEIRRAINTVPSARLVFLDGDMPNKAFPASDGDLLKPGATIRINAGYGDKDDAEQTLFEGVVVKHALRVDGANDARLVVECRDPAVRMTVGRRNANHLAQTDSAILTALIGAAGLQADVAATDTTYTELAQHYCSDWDFMLARAEANALLVIVDNGKVTVKPPAIDGAPVLKLTYGEDLIEFSGELDARTQYASAQAVSWDPKTQAAVLGAAAVPATLSAQGDLDSATLARVIGLSSLRLQAGAPLAKEGLTQWAKAQQLKAGLARVRGHMRFQGSAKAQVGSLVTVEGMGTRFSGSVYLSGVRHQLADGDWTTEAEFGLAPNWFVERADVRAPAAAGLLPGVEGLQVGVVLKLDGDPDGEHRIQVSVPVLQAESAGVWARLVQFHASNGIGTFFVPEIGDEVVLGYFGNDPSHPVVLGSLYSSKRPPPYELAAANDTKAFVTRCKSRIEFDEKDKVITVRTPGGNKIVLSDTDKSILLQDQNDNKVTLGPAGISLESPKDITLTAKGRIVVDAIGTVGVTSKADVSVAGLNVALQAQVGLSAKGSASAELSAAGQTSVKGALVMIN